MGSARIQITCRQCGKVVECYQSQRRTYCSFACRGASTRGKPTRNSGRHLNPDYFWSFVRKSEGDGCWEWNGHRNAKGYGHISVVGNLVLAHRHAWALTHGPIPEGMFCLHHCDNPPCVRPDHLYIGTKKDNARDRSLRGRGCDSRGELHPSAKLSAAQVREIRVRRASGERTSRVAKDYSVSPQLVSAIHYRRIWRHI